ncbi:MAG TPA: tyrosine-type recombinase/integrase [Edaphobacter sp.]|nr:tyrosine-type recombinase/integrase [Edaphobacter sp.]
MGIEHFGAHDLRRTCAKLCRKGSGDLEQIKFLLGHSSIQMTECYLGSEPRLFHLSMALAALTAGILLRTFKKQPRQVSWVSLKSLRHIAHRGFNRRRTATKLL